MVAACPFPLITGIHSKIPGVVASRAGLFKAPAHCSMLKPLVQAAYDIA